MNVTGALKRKMIYVVVIVLLLLPLFRLGQPATHEGGGGALVKMREARGLEESQLGEIDPASDSMRLATLGMRGVAASLLWIKTDEYRKRQEWDRLSATLDVIALLQPHFEKVWEHQAHNMSYNVSVEFDDYRQRYNWVKKGTEFLMRGVRRNDRAPRLVWYTGWFFGQKMGVSDEKRQFRRLFADDEPFHTVVAEQGIDVEGSDSLGPEGKPDNWLVGRQWMLKAYDLVDKQQAPLLRKNPLHFYQDAALWRSHYGVTIEQEGVLDERAGNAWAMAVEDWEDYGRRDIPTYDGYTVRLGDLEDMMRRTSELEKRFNTMVGDTEEQVKLARLEALPAEQKAALDTPSNKRTPLQSSLAALAERASYVTRADVAKALPKEQQLAALQLLSELSQNEAKTNKINGYRNQTNYDYWYTRSLAEMESTTLRARRLVYDADRLLDQAELDQALSKYEESFRLWADIFDRFPVLVTDSSSDDLVESIERYRRVLDQEQLPEDFPLKTFVQLKGEDPTGTMIMKDAYLEARAAEKAATEAASSEGDKPSEPDVPKEDKPAEKDSDAAKPADADADSEPKDPPKEDSDPATEPAKADGEEAATEAPPTEAAPTVEATGGAAEETSPSPAVDQ